MPVPTKKISPGHGLPGIPCPAVGPDVATPQPVTVRFTEIVVEHTAHILAVSQQEIGEVITACLGKRTGSAWNSIALRPGAIELESAAGDVRLGVVVVSLDELAAKHPGVTSLDPSKARCEGDLRVVVNDETLALRTGNDRVRVLETWREWRPGAGRNFGIVSRVT